MNRPGKVRAELVFTEHDWSGDGSEPRFAAEGRVRLRDRRELLPLDVSRDQQCLDLIRLDASLIQAQASFQHLGEAIYESIRFVHQTGGCLARSASVSCSSDARWFGSRRGWRFQNECPIGLLSCDSRDFPVVGAPCPAEFLVTANDSRTLMPSFSICPRFRVPGTLHYHR